MQNQNMTRIRTVFLHTNMVPAIADDLVAKYSGIEGYAIDQQKLATWTEVLKRDSEDSVYQSDRIYIIDPAGNLVMSYPADADPSYMKKDIKRLLKVSQIG
jgi:cytochrome oxidase Cu insertion factor (SCO1/SenC/PrrC family)